MTDGRASSHVMTHQRNRLDNLSDLASKLAEYLRPRRPAPEDRSHAVT